MPLDPSIYIRLKGNVVNLELSGMEGRSGFYFMIASMGGTSEMERATFGAGCFWGVEAVFRRVKGVRSTSVGYMGGPLENPTYEDVCTGQTGHAEVVEVVYDPSQVSYDDLLTVFWESHDPTTLNRQGPDIGTQYRSVIFYHNETQRASAKASKERLRRSGRYDGDIVTEVTPASQFYRAEDYHQKYLEKRGLASCAIG
jgi:peptide-methionine (S)-S-oxide reductase